MEHSKFERNGSVTQTTSKMGNISEYLRKFKVPSYFVASLSLQRNDCNFDVSYVQKKNEDVDTIVLRM